METIAFVALGGNIGNSIAYLRMALRELSSLKSVEHLTVSKFYRTSPVSPIPQGDFVNAVCRFQTTLSAHQLFAELERIERRLGKIPKPKDDPRVIDLDLLFFGSAIIDSPVLSIPHPRWKERLFVLVPLSDLSTTITLSDGNGGFTVWNIPDLVKSSKLQTVRVLDESSSY